jgi:hypothetical protein
MGGDLGAGLMHRLQRRAGQLELAARLQAERGANLRPLSHKADDVFAFAHGFPAEALHSFQQLADAGPAVIGHRLAGPGVVDEFLVLGADAPVGRRLAPPGEVANQVVAALDRAAGGLRNGHRAPEPDDVGANARAVVRRANPPRQGGTIIFVLT